MTAKNAILTKLHAAKKKMNNTIGFLLDKMVGIM